MSWNELIEKCDAQALEKRLGLPADFTAHWAPTAEDRQAAWELYTELRTRITVQPLHYMHGDEETALQSVADLFKMSRELIHKSGPQARHFATLTVFVLNRVIRPFTAEWHKRKCAGELNNEDTRHEFRGKLIDLQLLLRQFTSVLGRMAEGEAFCAGSESWPPTITPPPLETLEVREAAAKVLAATKIPFDIAFDDSVNPVIAARIRWDEHNEIRRLRGDQPLKLPEITSSINPPNAQQIVEQHKLPASSHDDRLKDIAGLAISGGGIRSATFALGVLQRLAEAGVLSRFDYLSTVSGGGYLGSFLSTYLNTPASDPNSPPVDIGLSVQQLPFRKPPVGESAPLRHLRGHSNYLFSGGFLNRLNMVLLAIHGVLANAVIFWPLIAGALLAVAGWQGGIIQDVIKENPFSLGSYLWHLTSQRAALGAMAAGLLSLAPAAWLCRRYRVDDWLPRYQTLVSFVLVGGVIVSVWNLIPPAFRQVDTLFKSNSPWSAWLPNTALLSGAVVVLQRFWANLDWAPAASKLKRVVSLTIMVLIGPLFAAALFLWLGHVLIVEQPKIWIGNVMLDPILLLTVLTFVPLLFGLVFLDVNQTSLHPFYRRKLSQAYLIAHSTNTGQVEPQDGMRLSEMRQHNPQAPYHLINCALNAPSSQNGAVRGRGTDFFLFSQRYCGSAATGYHATEEWEARDSHLNLGTAMAISAGAASPFMGVVSLPSANFIMALFNIRLDYWLSVPGCRYVPLHSWHAGPLYLLRQAFGWMDETTPFVNVSDGGHIENLGLYELLRRRCRYIVAIDGECDPNLSCGALMQLMRFAKIDFGIDINMNMSRYRRTTDGNSPFHFALGTIQYPKLNEDSPSATGLLLYIKLSRTGNEPPGVEHYRLKNSVFPHQSTADQFFDEDQFEAYRALGEHAANDLFSSELLGNHPKPESLEDWFGKISSALHDPNNK